MQRMKEMKGAAIGRNPGCRMERADERVPRQGGGASI
jgi:hypothetical protein